MARLVRVLVVPNIPAASPSVAAPIDVILPAGGRIAGEFAQETGIEIKARLPVGNQTILSRSIATLREMSCIGRIVVIGPDELKDEATSADALIPEGDSGPDNIFRGLQWLQENQAGNRVLDSQNSADQSPKTQDQSRVLVMTTDLPFVTSQAVQQFLDSCADEADICIPIVARQSFESRFPGAPGVWLRLQDGEWTLGCAFLLRVEALNKSRPHIERIFAARKSPLQMAKLLGPIFIARLLTKRLTVAHIKERCERVLDCRGSVIQNAAPELAFDIDDAPEYRYVVKHLNN
jgi:CTP:molybdopterin cytidylyltransferase MocA